jgi:PAS domain S-box-containing protein
MSANTVRPFESRRNTGGAGPDHWREATTTAALLGAIEQTSDTVFVTDRHGVITYVNPAFEARTGFPACDAIGATPRLLSSGHHDAALFERLWATILSGRVFRFVVTNKTRDGRLYEEDQTITPVRDRWGRLSHFVATGRDAAHRRRTEEALRRLSGQLERESARIAGALHDEAGQFLSAAHITIADVARDLSPVVQARLLQARQHLDEVAAQLRRVSHELHPSILVDLGLPEAIRHIASAFSRRTGVRLTIDTDLARPCPPLVATVVYRFVQEALTNMGRHARATSGTLGLQWDGVTLSCAVGDNGVGFDEDQVARKGTRGIGLLLIRDRIEAAGGTFQIATSTGRGTELRMTMSLEG